MPEICLKDSEGSSTAIELCQHLARAISENHIYVFDYNELINILARRQPLVLLDVFLGSPYFKESQRRRLFDLERRGNPLDQITDDDIIVFGRRKVP